jgi:hypothetical protein
MHCGHPWLLLDSSLGKIRSLKALLCSPISPADRPYSPGNANMVAVSYHFERIDSSVSMHRGIRWSAFVQGVRRGLLSL